MLRQMKPIFAAIWLAEWSLNCSAMETVIFKENFAHGLTNGWENVAFFKKLTSYQILREENHYFLRGVAEKGCSALTTKLALAPSPKLTLRWRWRVAGVNPNGAERDLKKFDHAARLVVAFDTLIGPPRTLNYFWANVELPGTVLEHPKSGRAQMLILESGNAKASQWVAEERDLVADWKKVFPGKPMTKMVALGVMTDSDSLGQTLTGDYADIEMRAESTGK